MADHRIPSQQANPILENAHPHPALHQVQGQNPHGAGGDQQGVYREGDPRPEDVQGEIQYPRHMIDAHNYNAAHYLPPPPPYPPQLPQAPYVYMHRDYEIAEPVLAQAHQEAHPFAPGVQENYDGYGGHFPAADPPEAFPGAQPYPAPPANMPLAANSLRNIAGRFLNNPGTNINMLRIERGPNGRFEMWIALELADIF